MTTRRTRRPGAADAGFTLMEVVVAMTIFTVLVSAVLGLILRTTQVAGTNHRRVEAASLANRQIESARSMRAIDIPDGGTVRTETVGGTAYSVRQTATYLPADSTTTICSSSGTQLAYKLVTVTVTWPNMGTIPAVRADTLRAVGVGSDGLDASLGSVAVGVLAADGKPVSDVTVTLAPGGTSVTTGADGCAVFTGLTAGTYVASADSAGYVGVANAQLSAAGGIGVTAGAVAHGTLTYDTARSVTLQPGGPAGFTAVTGVPVMLRDSYITDTNLPACSATVQACLAAFPGQATNLFPAVYEMWTGTCADAHTATAVDLGPAVPNGGTATVAMGAASIDVQVLGVSTPGRTIYVSHAADASCATGEHYTVPTSVVGGVGVLVPYGTWTFSLWASAPPGSGTTTVTLTDSGTQSLVLRTNS